MESITAQNTAAAFISCWLSRFGSPTRITTDQGRQFESELFRALGQTIGSQRHRTTSYHPCANGLVERFHRHLKSAIMCHPGMNWLEALPLVLLGIRASFKEDLKTSSSELVYGEPLRLPGELITSNNNNTMTDPSEFVTSLRLQMAKLRPVPASCHSKPSEFVFKDLDKCTHVFLRDDTVRKALQPPYSGPHLVVKRTEKTFTLWIRGKETVVSVDRIKPAYILPQDALPVPAPVKISAPPGKEDYVTRSGRRVKFRLPDN